MQFNRNHKPRYVKAVRDEHDLRPRFRRGDTVIYTDPKTKVRREVKIIGDGKGKQIHVQFLDTARTEYVQTADLNPLGQFGEPDVHHKLIPLSREDRAISEMSGGPDLHAHMGIPSHAPNLIFEDHLKETTPEVEKFIALPEGKETADDINFKSLYGIDVKIKEAEYNLNAYDSIYKKVKAYHKEEIDGLIEIDRILDDYVLNEIEMKKESAANQKIFYETWEKQKKRKLDARVRMALYQEDGILDNNGDPVEGMKSVLLRLQNKYIPEATERLSFLKRKYQKAIDLIRDNKKFIMQQPGMKFTKEGKYKKYDPQDPEDQKEMTMEFDDKGIMYIPDGKGGREPYFYKDKKGKIWRYKHQDKSKLRQWWEWLND